MTDESRYSVLLKKYLENTILKEELYEFFNLSQDRNSAEILGDMIRQDLIKEETDNDGPGMLPETAAEIYRKILASEKSTNRLFAYDNRKKVSQILSLAAMVLVLVFGAVFFYTKTTREATSGSFITSIPKGSINKVNESSIPVELVLEDGSKVKLSPNASLSFPEHFLHDKREVYLTGEAVFAVTKNPAKPFLVYYRQIVTKVLGTSFKIKTNPNSKNVEVSVITGKVQVLENDNTAMDNDAKGSVKSVILMPNEKAMYNTKLHDFKTTLADSIQLLVPHSEIDETLKSNRIAESFLFEKATSVKLIFSQLQKLYGIEIMVDDQHINNCVFTGDISKQEMLEKLKIICLTIGATYEIKGTKIWVSGKGCN
jgi:hypothetical protein